VVADDEPADVALAVELGVLVVLEDVELVAVVLEVVLEVEAVAVLEAVELEQPAAVGTSSILPIFTTVLGNDEYTWNMSVCCPVSPMTFARS
jgi:hypothetical protein